MQVLKVVAEGLITSFRYPHFMQEVQPTFEMPPPATIYGHVCSALGEWLDPNGVAFAIRFSYEAAFEDVEHTHLVSAGSGRLKESGEPEAIGGSIVPFRRGLLFHPRLVLYLNRPEWAACFRSPRYPVALGRSQDLFTYSSVDVVELERVSSAYFEHTLVPYSFARRTDRGLVVLMPRFLDYQHRREPTFGRYVVLHRRVHTRNLVWLSNEPKPSFWADPTEPQVDGDALGLAFHTWVGEDDSVLRLS
jgi:CRISPR-associated protein Cas5t